MSAADTTKADVGGRHDKRLLKVEIGRDNPLTPLIDALLKPKESTCGITVAGGIICLAKVPYILKTIFGAGDFSKLKRRCKRKVGCLARVAQEVRSVDDRDGEVTLQLGDHLYFHRSHPHLLSVRLDDL